MDNNMDECAIPPLALVQKNAPFAGTDGGVDHWAVVASLVETCKLAGVAPQTYPTGVFAGIGSDHPNSRTDEFLWANTRARRHRGRTKTVEDLPRTGEIHATEPPSDDVEYGIATVWA